MENLKEALKQEIEFVKSRYSDVVLSTHGNLIIIRCTDKKERPCLRIYLGRSAKPIVNFYYKDYDKREERIAIEKSNEDSRELFRIKRKEEKKSLGTPKSKVGDVFVESWGYEQTNVNYYQIIERPSDHYAIVQEICAAHVSGSFYAHGMADEVVPSNNDFVKDSKPFRVKLNASKDGSESFKVRDWGSWAVKTDGTKTYRSWYY